MNSTSLIIFDCDGVLIDSETLSIQSLMEALAEHGVNITMQEGIERYVGKSSAHENGDTEKRYGAKLPISFDERKQHIRKKLFEEKLKATEGIVDLLDDLQIRKCIASSSSHERLHHTLGLVHLWDRFAPHIFSSTQVKNGKPAPDLFLFAAQQMQADPSECLVIEDSIAGVQAAKAANMRVFGFTGGSHCTAEHGNRLLNEGAEKVFSHMRDLSAVLSSIGSYGAARA